MKRQRACYLQRDIEMHASCEGEDALDGERGDVDACKQDDSIGFEMNLTN